MGWGRVAIFDVAEGELCSTWTPHGPHVSGPVSDITFRLDRMVPYDPACPHCIPHAVPDHIRGRMAIRWPPHWNLNSPCNYVSRAGANLGCGSSVCGGVSSALCGECMRCTTGSEYCQRNVMWTGVGTAPMALIPGSLLLRSRPNTQLDVAVIVYACEWIAIEFNIIICSEHDYTKSPICNLYVFYM